MHRPGISNIIAELLQCSSIIVNNTLLNLTRKIYEKSEVPGDHCKSIIKTILEYAKQESLSSLEN